MFLKLNLPDRNNLSFFHTVTNQHYSLVVFNRRYYLWYTAYRTTKDLFANADSWNTNELAICLSAKTYNIIYY